MKRIISISICMVFLLSASTILLAPEKMEKRWTFEKFEKTVRQLIEDRNAKLVCFFSAGEYYKMPGELKNYNTKLVTHEGEIITGKDSENYWRKVGKIIGNQEGRKLKFKKPHLELMELEVGPEPEPEEFDFIAIEITEFSFKVGKTTYKGYIDPSYRHRVRCTIDE